MARGEVDRVLLDHPTLPPVRARPLPKDPGMTPRLQGFWPRIGLVAGLALLPLAGARMASLAAAPANVDWANVGNDQGGTRFSPLTQINRETVKGLRVAWTYHTGDSPGRSAIECTPLVIDGVLYATTCSPRVKVVALNAETGKEIWKYDPWKETTRYPVSAGGVNRGVAYWSDGKRDGARRVLYASADGRLISLDAKTGTPDPAFGKQGIAGFREGMEDDLSSHSYGCTSAPAVYQDLVILGFAVSEGPRPGAPGDIRAFDVRTGRPAWRFHTVPRPGEFGHDTWTPTGWQRRGGVNAWGGVNVDAERGIVLCGTGSASYDWFGADRAGNNLFANCALALNAKTGRRLWHYQTVRHDVWDYDQPAPPITVRVRRNGGWIDAVAMCGKSGYCWLFDRTTGKPLFDVVDKPAPKSDVPGEETAPTQPVPVKPPPITEMLRGEEDLTNLSPEAHAEAVARFRLLRYEGPFTPASLQGSLAVPGFHGGATWSGSSFDPSTQTLYVNTNNTPVVLALEKTGDGELEYRLKRTQMGRSRTGRGLDDFYFNDKDGYPATKPPWGQLIAIDLNRGEFRWKVPLGEYPELTAKGIPRTGTENFGGSIVTAGGLVFIGAAQDERLHAFDSATGALLWEHQLEAGGYATPCTYMVDGRQYVVIAAGGGGKIGTRSGDAYVAFALPEGK